MTIICKICGRPVEPCKKNMESKICGYCEEVPAGKENVLTEVHVPKKARIVINANGLIEFRKCPKFRLFFLAGRRLPKMKNDRFGCIVVNWRY